MYIESIQIKNFRNFKDFSMKFHDGLNVIVGANNSGKTGLIKAITLLNDHVISVDDFNQNNLLQYYVKYKDEAPNIEIEYCLSHIIVDDDFKDESFLRLIPFINTKDVRGARTDGGDAVKYELHAKIKAEYSLDSDFSEEYRRFVGGIRVEEAMAKFRDYKLRLKHYIDDKAYKWTYRNAETGVEVDAGEVLKILDIQYISAERSYDDVKKEVRKELVEAAKEPSVRLKRDAFLLGASNQLKEVFDGTLQNMAELFKNEGDSIGLKHGDVAIATDIQIDEKNIADTYRTEVKDTRCQYTLPLDHNGLGYNNLINMYMLIKLNEQRSSNVRAILCIEEPEAHLHPAMQYKLFKYLRDRNGEQGQKQQIIVSTHSSNISAVAGLENMFMMAYCRAESVRDCRQQSLKELFAENSNDNKVQAKKHLSKFLDVTRSDMLFADKIILVEGIAERLLLPKFMEKCGCSYENAHVSIVEIGGRHFEHFIELFYGNAVEKKVLCITDRDLEWVVAKDSPADTSSFCTKSEYDASGGDGHIAKLKGRFLKGAHPMQNLKIQTQMVGGRTFEDELFITNFANETVASNLFNRVIPDQLKMFFSEHKFNAHKWEECIGSIDGRVKKTVQKYIDVFSGVVAQDRGNEEFYAQLMFAEIYLHYASSRKGELALGLLVDGSSDLEVPKYIKEGLEWLK